MALNDIDRDRDRALDRAYGAAVREEPPAHLDARILAAARREAGARPRALGSRLQGWRVPISIAAVVVVSVSLVSLVREEGGDHLVHPGAPPPRATKRSAPDSQPRPAPSQPSQAPRRDPAAAPDATVADQKRGDRSAGGIASGATPPGERTAEPAQAPEVSAKLADPEKGRPAERSVAKGSGEGPEAPERPARPAEEISGAADSIGPARRQEAQPPALSKPDPGARSEAEGRQAPAAESAAMPRAVPAPAPQARARSEPLRQRPLTDPGSPELAALVREYDALPARDWLNRIRELRKGGRTALASGMLDEFKRRYPDHPLPPELQKEP